MIYFPDMPYNEILLGLLVPVESWEFSSTVLS